MLAFFAVVAGYVCENRLIQNEISLLSLDQENLDMFLVVRIPRSPSLAVSLLKPDGKKRSSVSAYLGALPVI